MIDSSFQNFLWFLRRPKMYPEMIRRLGRKIGSIFGLEREQRTSEARWRIKEKTRHWCALKAVDTETAILKITGKSPTVKFSEKFKDLIEEQQKLIESIPNRMGGQGNLEIIYQLAEYVRATRAIETGVSYGWSSLTLLLSLNEREGSQLVSTDLPYFSEHSESYVGCVVPDRLKSIWTILPYADREALIDALKILPQIDLCHYDSDKFYQGKMWAYPLLWQALKPGGIFIADDIDDDFAFRDFCEEIDRPPWIVETPFTNDIKYVGILVK
jgi:predicted O-methyltransferase YrrM